MTYTAEIIKDIANALSFLLVIAYTSSGLLLWPIRRWVHRKQKIHGRALYVLFFIQAAALPFFVLFSAYYRNALGFGNGWQVLWVEFNVLFTVFGILAWVRDSRYERKSEVSHAA